MEKHARWDIIFFVGVFSSLNTREVRKKEPKLVQDLELIKICKIWISIYRILQIK